MTDYLEELVENTNVLLERLMQLEQGMFVGENGDLSGENTDINLDKFLVYKHKMSVNLKLDKDYKKSSGRFFGETERAVENKSSGERPLQAEEWTQAEKPALMEELERAERMSTAIETGKTFERRGTEGEFSSLGIGHGHISLAGRAEADRNEAAGFGVVQPELTAGETLDWAEQADRVFRRDSRRYDGGFCLY